MQNERYEELEETTTHFYDELGKLSEAPLLTPKESKKLRKLLTEQLFMAVDLHFKKSKNDINQSKVLLKEEKEEFKKYHKKEKEGVSFLTKVKEVLHIGKREKKVQFLTDGDTVSLPAQSETQSSAIEASDKKEENKEQFDDKSP
mgnify:CR=1 FL=1